MFNPSSILQYQQAKKFMVFFEITHLEVSYRYRHFNSQTKTKIASQKNTQAILACQRQSAYENCKKEF